LDLRGNRLLCIRDVAPEIAVAQIDEDIGGSGAVDQPANSHNSFREVGIEPERVRQTFNHHMQILTTTCK
jgi:hypothetical protein